MKFDDIQSIYFIGIGGAGMSGLARMAFQHGKTVMGSDAVDSDAVKKLRSEGLTIHAPHGADHVPLDYDLYVYSAAVPEDNPERMALATHGLTEKSMTYFEAVGDFMKIFAHRIAISGTHGKTTTTAMMALVLEEAALDPTAIVGSIVNQWDSNVRVGKDREYFVVEACEYKAHMLKLHPDVIVLTNIEEDHLDYYKDLNHIQITFQNYIDLLPANGMLVRNADDSECRDLGFDGKTISYGISEPADVMATNIAKADELQRFQVGKDTYELRVPGDFNIYNALAVIAYAQYLHIPVKTIQSGLKKFSGTWRRFEIVGSYRDAIVISDYAHHPTALTGLIKAAHEWYPNRRIVIVFQPHQHNRTRTLFQGFVEAFNEADLIIIQEIFDVKGREAVEDSAISSQDIVNKIEETGKLVIYSPNHERSKQILAEHIEPNDVVLIVGAGDIYTLATDLCSKD